MSKTVRLRSKSSSDYAIGEAIVPAYGSLIMDYRDFLAAAKGCSVDSESVSVEFDSGMVDVSISDFGAKGNGIDDDTLAIQEAIDFVLGLGGGLIRVPVGVYVIDGISISGGYVMLDGDSMENSVFKSNGAVAVSWADATGGIVDMQVICDGGTAFHIAGGSSLFIERCTVDTDLVFKSEGGKCNVASCTMHSRTFYEVSGNGTINEQFCVYDGGTE